MSFAARLRAIFGQPKGDRIPPHQPGDVGPAILSPGRKITDPNEADQLGLTAEARRLRGKPTV